MGSQKVRHNLGTLQPQEYQQSLHLLWAYLREEVFLKNRFIWLSRLSYGVWNLCAACAL